METAGPAVKEMRLLRIGSIAAGNASPARRSRRCLAWKEERSVSMNLTLQYDQVLFILEPTGIARRGPRKTSHGD